MAKENIETQLKPEQEPQPHQEDTTPSVEQEHEPQQENSTLSLKSKLIREYEGHEFTLWGEEESLRDLEQCLRQLYDSQRLVRVSDVMTSLDLEPDTDDYDCWWGLDRRKEEDEDEDEDPDDAIVVTEFTKSEFNESRLTQVLKKLEHAKGFHSIAWEKVFYLDI